MNKLNTSEEHFPEIDPHKFRHHNSNKNLKGNDNSISLKNINNSESNFQLIKNSECKKFYNKK